MVTCYEEKIVDWYTTYGVNNTDKEKKDTHDAVMATLDGKAYPGLSSWQLAMLMKWAKNDPVSDKEIERNKAVYAIQKNRNPFIDYPGLERFVWGDLKDEAFSYDHYSTTGIIEMEKTSVDEQQPDVIFAPDGKRLEKPSKGLNIIRLKNGKVIKFVKGLQTFAN